MESTSEKNKAAAVLVPLIVDLSSRDLASENVHGFFTLQTSQGSLALPAHTEVLLTVRTDLVEHHKGQISFPGGVRDSQDETLLHTALRECYEEIGLPLAHIRVVAELTQTHTVSSGFLVSSFVGVVDVLPPLQPNPHEISKLLYVPLSHLLNPAFKRQEAYERDRMKVTLPVFMYEEHRIWGATAVILQKFLGLVEQGT